MGSMWLTCCSRDAYARLFAEVRSRDACATVLRFGEAGDLPRMIGEFPGRDVNAALVADAVDESLLDAVGALSRGGQAKQILVLADSQDPAMFARLFYAGATEVIAAGPLASPIESSGACAERGPNDAKPSARSACNNESSFPCAGERPCASGSVSLPARSTQVAQASPAVCVATEGWAPAAISPSVSSPEKEVSAEPASPWSMHGDPSPDAMASGEGCALHARGDAAQPPGAPMVAAISGRGGVGKSTLVASLAYCSAHMGLRAAVIDADLMFGNQYELLGVDAPIDLGVLADKGVATSPEEAAEASAMKIAPGLTLWGSLETPEMAEVMAAPIDELVRVLRGAADVIFVDTSTFWGDCVASLVASCDRCLVVGAPGACAVSSSVKAMGLASRVGVPGTKMTGVFNRFGGEGAGEEQAMRYEMGVALRSRVRIADGGDEVRGMASFGHLDSLLLGPGAFATSVRSFARDLLRELGCPVEVDEYESRRSVEDRPRIRLPWKKKVGGAA